MVIIIKKKTLKKLMEIPNKSEVFFNYQLTKDFTVC